MNIINNIKQCFVYILLVSTILFMLSTIAYAEPRGRTYTGSEDKTHCTLWNTEVLRWPQKILGLETDGV